MSILAKLFSSGASTLVSSVGAVIDSLVTSDEERLKLKNALEIAIMNNKLSQERQALEYEQQLTTRHAMDMKADSWLSKNIRPLTLAFLTVSTVLLAYSTVFILEEKDLAILSPWIDLLKTMLGVVFVFYFGSRGLEKIQSIKRK